MSCILRIKGESFDLNGFLESVKIIPYQKHYIREKRQFKRKGEQLLYKTSGCKFELSNADFNQFDVQKKEVISYLSENFEELKTAYSFGLKTTEKPTIDFAIENNFIDFWLQTFPIPIELIKLSSNLNFEIEISLYHPTSEDNE